VFKVEHGVEVGDGAGRVAVVHVADASPQQYIGQKARAVQPLCARKTAAVSSSVTAQWTGRGEEERTVNSIDAI
jgi:hypothetical protein